MALAFDQLSELNMSRTTWKIKARVTRMWPSISNQTVEGRDSLKGYNLILLDDDNCHVQAFIYADNWKSIADKIDEGGLYIITNFYTKEATGSLKPVSSRILINFSNTTTIEKVSDDDFMIPRHKFELVDLGDLFTVASNYVNDQMPEYAIDVIGVLEDFEHVRSIKTVYGQRNIVRFRITDGRNSHKVSVWGDLAVSTESDYTQAVERPIIVILTSIKLKIYKNSVQISTLPSSKVYLNLDNDHVTAMRQRLAEEGYIATQQPIATPPETFVETVVQPVTLKELSDKTGNEFIKKHFFCYVKISHVEEGIWWYDSCSDCQGQVERIEGRLRCATCTNKIIPVPEKRFRIVILAGDSTEAYNFVLMDRAAKRILGMSATKLISDMMKSSTSFPPKIKDLNGKEIKLKIQLSEDNINSGSRLYYATDAFDSTCTTSSMTGFAISGTSENNVVDLSEGGMTPGSAKSTSKKIKTEK